MMFAGIIWAIIVLCSTYYLKSCVITKFTQTDRVDYHLGTMLGARGRQQASGNRNGNRPLEPKFKGGTPGYEDVVFAYRKGMKQGDWKENLQALLVIEASSMKYGGSCLTRAIRTMEFLENPELLEPGANSLVLITKKQN